MNHGDGTCHSDYISCLKVCVLLFSIVYNVNKSLSRIAEEVASVSGDEVARDPLADAVAQAMSSGVASFSDKGLMPRRLLRHRDEFIQFKRI